MCVHMYLHVYIIFWITCVDTHMCVYFDAWRMARIRMHTCVCYYKEDMILWYYTYHGACCAHMDCLHYTLNNMCRHTYVCVLWRVTHGADAYVARQCTHTYVWRMHTYVCLHYMCNDIYTYVWRGCIRHAWWYSYTSCLLCNNIHTYVCVSTWYVQYHIPMCVSTLYV